MKRIGFAIEGMSCQHCVGRVKKAIDALRGIISSDVRIGSAVVDYDDSVIGDAEIRDAIEKAGYKTT